MVEQEATHDARTDLSDLVRDRRAELRLSLRALAQRTADPETGVPVIKPSTLENLEKNSPRMTWVPRVPELKALARALECPLARVRDAAGAQFFGIDSLRDQSGEVKAMVAHAESLSPEDQAKVAAIVEAYARQSRSSDGA